MIRNVLMSLSLVSAGLFAATPALAYDPCVRATDRREAADAAVFRWIRSHCTNNGSCYGNPAEFQRLREAALDARAEQARACR